MRKFAALAVGLLAAAILAACAEVPPETKAEKLVNQSLWTLETFKKSRQKPLSLFHTALAEAQGILILPGTFKAGFVLGAEYGDGVLLVRRPDGSWSMPAFYSMGAGSFGLQIGGQVAEVAVVLRNAGAVRAVVEHQGKLGADMEVTVATVGAGMEGATTTNIGADIVAFSTAAGLYAGGSLEGAAIIKRNDLNAAFYGPGATPETILYGTTLSNPKAGALRTALANQ